MQDVMNSCQGAHEHPCRARHEKGSAVRVAARPTIALGPQWERCARFVHSTSAAHRASPARWTQVGALPFARPGASGVPDVAGEGATSRVPHPPRCTPGGSDMPLIRL